MAKEISIIRQEAQQVQNATQVGENTAQRVGGVLTDIVDKAEEHETDIDNLNANMGVDDYPVFSTSEDYKSGDTVNYQGLLYRFTSDHAAGAWNGTDVEEANVVKAHIVQELGDSEDKVMSQKAVTDELAKKANQTDVEGALAGKVDNADIVQKLGNNNENLISQQATTKNLLNIISIWDNAKIENKSIRVTV